MSDVFLAGGEDAFSGLLKRVSMSRLRTYQLFDHIKARARLVKLNNEHLRKAAPRLWGRLAEHDEDLAADLSQAILVSNLDMVVAALDHLGISHKDGFFSKDADLSSHLGEGWQQRTYDALKDRFPPAVLAFYLNHLGVEVGKQKQLFAPQS